MMLDWLGERYKDPALRYILLIKNFMDMGGTFTKIQKGEATSIMEMLQGIEAIFSEQLMKI
jgi:hypothetical protein